MLQMSDSTTYKISFNSYSNKNVKHNSAIYLILENVCIVYLPDSGQNIEQGLL